MEAYARSTKEARENVAYEALPPEKKLAKMAEIENEFKTKREQWIAKYVTTNRQKVDEMYAAKYQQRTTDPLERIAAHQERQMEWEHLDSTMTDIEVVVAMEHGGSDALDRLIEHPGFAQRVARKAGKMRGPALVEMAHRRIRETRIANDPELSVLTDWRMRSSPTRARPGYTWA